MTRYAKKYSNKFEVNFTNYVFTLHTPIFIIFFISYFTYRHYFHFSEGVASCIIIVKTLLFMHI